MKTPLSLKKLGTILGGIIACQLPAQALTLTYEQDPDGVGGINIGDVYTGPVQIFIEGLSAGTIYNPFGGPGGIAGSASSAVGVGIMDGTVVNAFTPTIIEQSPGSIGSEDVWAIGFVTRIVDPFTNANIWTPLGKGQQITGISYGQTDFWGQQSGSVQTISGINQTIDLYEQTPLLPVPSLAGVLPTQRTGLDSYPNFAPNGSPLIARFNTVNGFLDAGAGITDTEVLTQFVNSVGAQGASQAFAEVDNTVGQQIAPGQSIFENNGFTGVFNSNLADARFVFSTQTLPTANPWTVSITGPIETQVGTAVPEPGSALAILACLLPVASLRNRRARGGRA
jgi:hypothetical protein